MKPTRDELTDYQAEAGLSFDPDAFLDHYESVGWKIGNRPMKDWKATARNWDRREKQSGQGRTGRAAGQSHSRGIETVTLADILANERNVGPG